MWVIILSQTTSWDRVMYDLILLVIICIIVYYFEPRFLFVPIFLFVPYTLVWYGYVNFFDLVLILLLFISFCGIISADLVGLLNFWLIIVVASVAVYCNWDLIVVNSRAFGLEIDETWKNSSLPEANDVIETKLLCFNFLALYSVVLLYL